MKSFLSSVSLCFIVAVVVIGLLLQTGCEEATGLQGLQVDPSSVVLTTNNQTVVFTVTGLTNEILALPLVWTVQNADLGQIVFSGGYSATYQRSAPNGVNSITVRDQYDNEGYASIRQSAANYSLELSATDTSILTGEATTITITTASAEAPFSWRKVSGPGALTGDSGSRSAAYVASSAGTAVIRVSDANGASGVISIVVQEPPDDDDDGGGGGGGPGGA